MKPLSTLLLLLVACTPTKKQDDTQHTTPKARGAHSSALYYLTPAELPKGLKEVKLETKKRAPAVTRGPFVKFQGLKTGYRLWKGSVIFIDSRWAFPSPAKARGFFAAAEKMNSEGLTAATSPQIGARAKLFTGLIKHPKLPIELRSALVYFQKGRVVAKLFMAWEQPKGKPVDKTEEVIALAQKVARKIP